MEPQYIQANVRARCPDCGGALSNFERSQSSGAFGSVIKDWQHQYEGGNYTRVLYVLMRCGGCGRGGLAKIHDRGQVAGGRLESFYPTSIDHAPLPQTVPPPIVSEYREAELCASFEAWRAASALLRSTLEKTLRANGYKDGSLAARIDEVASDGIITRARQRRAHEEVRVLGNDVLHEEWRPIEEREYAASHHYTQRILEDFYDHRSEVEALLRQAKRILPPVVQIPE